MSTDEFLQAVRSKKAPAPTEQLVALERLLGCSLPEDYRRFLVACNGGFVGGSLWFMGPTPDGDAAEAGVHHIGGFRTEYHFSLTKRRETYGIRIPSSLLWIMDDPFGNAICLGLQAPHRGHVYFWDHEREPDRETWDGSIETAGNLQLLSRSFTGFVSGLVEQPAE